MVSMLLRLKFNTIFISHLLWFTLHVPVVKFRCIDPVQHQCLQSKKSSFSFSFHIMRRSNCSVPIPPPGHPGNITFLGACPCLLITLFFPCPTLYKHFNLSFFQWPALIYHTHFSSDPGAEQFDWRISGAGKRQNSLDYYEAFSYPSLGVMI